jgi:hypothetical protein
VLSDERALASNGKLAGAVRLTRNAQLVFVAQSGPALGIAVLKWVIGKWPISVVRH